MTDVPDDVFGNSGTTTGMISTDDAAPELVIGAILYCCGCWHRDARIIGNIRSGDIDRAVRQIMADKEADAARIAELDAALAAERARADEYEGLFMTMQIAFEKLQKGKRDG